MTEMGAAMGNWWLAASSRQRACSCITSHSEFFGETSNHPGNKYNKMWGLSRRYIFPWNMKNKDIYWRYKIHETLYIRQRCLSPLQRRYLGTPHSSPDCHQLPWISSMAWKLLPFKGDFSFGKSKKKTPNLGWVTRMIWCFTKKLWIRCDAWVVLLPWWSCQSPVAHSYGLLNYPNSFHGGMFKVNAKFDANSLLYSLSHFECDGHRVHILIQMHLLPPLTSTVKSSLFTHAHSSPLSLAARLHQCHTNCFHYINSGWAFSRQTL